MLQSSGLAASTALLSTYALSGGRASASDKKDQPTAVIVGSGFGGSVAALRLGQAGYRVIVMERGRAWPLQKDGKTFPATLQPDGRSAWFSDHANINRTLSFIPIQRYPGLIDRITGNGLDAVFGAGVGGGSLVFGSFTPQPRKQEWDQIFPPEITYEEMDRVWFPLAKKELGVSPVPDDILNHPKYHASRAWLDVVHAAGGDVVRHDFAMDWDIVRDELAGKAVPSVTIGEYVFGTNSGAKISLDRTYLARAEATKNVEIQALTEVHDVTELRDGRMRVSARNINHAGQTVGEVTEEADLVVMAAGSFHTTNMLLRWRETGRLPRLSAEVGRNYGTNGDFIYGQAFPNPKFGPVQAGPGVGLYYDDANPHGPVSISWEAAPLPLGLGTVGTTNLLQVMTDQRGEVAWDPATQRGVLTYPFPKGDSAADQHAQFSAVRFQNLAYRRWGAIAGGAPVWTPLADLGASTTWHGLGGAVMDNTRVHHGAKGAIATNGQVHGYPRMLVVDGAGIPGTVGMVNPALTITALAERIMGGFLNEAGK